MNDSSLGPLAHNQDSYVGVLVAITVLVTFAALILISQFSNLPVNMNCAMFLEGAKRWLAGEILYIDFVDTNPPMAFYIALVPLVLSRISGISLEPMFHLFVTALVLYSSITIYFFSQRLYDAERRRESAIICVGWLFFSVYVCFWGWYGERDFLFIITFVPFLYCRMARYSGKTVPPILAIVCGLVAAPFLLQKPYFLVVPAVVELFMLWSTKRARVVVSPETVCVILAGLWYGSYWFTGNQSATAYLDRWVPFLRRHFGCYGATPGELLVHSLPGFPLAALFPQVSLVAGFVFAWMSDGETRFEFRVLSLLVFAAFLEFFIQFKGSHYHLLPAIGCSMLLWSVGVGRCASFLPSKARNRSYASVIYVIFCGFISLGCAAGIVHRLEKKDTVDEDVRALSDVIVQESKSGERILPLTTYFAPALPALIRSDRMGATPYIPAWPILLTFCGRNQIPQSVAESCQDEFTWEKNQILAEIAKDIKRQRPALILLDTGNNHDWTGHRTFRLDKYLECGNWKEEFLADYKRVSMVGNFEVYRIAD